MRSVAEHTPEYGSLVLVKLNTKPFYYVCWVGEDKSHDVRFFEAGGEEWGWVENDEVVSWCYINELDDMLSKQRE